MYIRDVCPWERQQGEPNLWYGRFVHYREIGTERTIVGAWRKWKIEDPKGQKSRAKAYHRSWNHNAKVWDWKERAELYDAYMDEIVRQEEQLAAREMVRRHIELGVDMQDLGGQHISHLKASLEEISAGDARMMVKDGIEIERKARGLPDHLLEIAFEVANMTDEELLEWREERPETQIGGSGDSPKRLTSG